MKTNWIYGLSLSALLVVGTASGQDNTGQDNIANDVRPTRPDSPSDAVNVIQEQGKKIGLPEGPRVNSGAVAVDRPEPVQPTELKEMITRFQTERELYLKRQRMLATQLRQSSDEERKALREQMRDNLDQWRELQLEFRAQVKDRAIELRRELQSELREVVNEGAKEDGSTRRRE
jgi:hypothetical protein